MIKINKKIMIKLNAFTLAEVLITLGIIGVVAAMTIPTLINNYQNQVYVTIFKKGYKQLSQAMAQVIGDYNCSDIVCTGLSSNGFGAALAKSFKLSEECGPGLNECFSGGYVPSGWTFYYDGSNRTTASGPFTGSYKFVTADGIAFAINYYGACSDNSAAATGSMSQHCGWIAIDTNGLKGPNSFGRDLWEFWIGNGKGITVFYPVGGAEWSAFYWKTANYCNSSNPYGAECAGRVMEEGWQINY